MLHIFWKRRKLGFFRRKGKRNHSNINATIKFLNTITQFDNAGFNNIKTKHNITFRLEQMSLSNSYNI